MGDVGYHDDINCLEEHLIKKLPVGNRDIDDVCDVLYLRSQTIPFRLHSNHFSPVYAILVDLAIIYCHFIVHSLEISIFRNYNI
jgi:hypothetical protein